MAVTASPSRATLGGRVDRGSVVSQCYLCGIFLGIVDVLPVIPISSGDVLALNGDRAGPRRTSAWKAVSELDWEYQQICNGKLTTSIGHDLVDWRVNLGLTALF